MRQAIPRVYVCHSSCRRACLQLDAAVAAKKCSSCDAYRLDGWLLDDRDANPAVRIFRAEVPNWSSAERQVFSVEVGEPAPKVARFATVAASTLDDADACDLGGSSSLGRIEDADRKKFCKALSLEGVCSGVPLALRTLRRPIWSGSLKTGLRISFGNILVDGDCGWSFVLPFPPAHPELRSSLGRGRGEKGSLLAEIC